MKILIAEDSSVQRTILGGCLRRWDYEVVEARDGAEAWQLFQQDLFPLILTDWMMPEVDGIELVRRIRACDLPSYVYIVLLTARSEKPDLVLAMDAGADDYLAKPFHPDELRVRLREGERIIRLERTLAEQNRRLQDAQAALVESEKLAGLGQLAAGMAHELNNPLAFITNNLAILRRETMEMLQALDDQDALLRSLGERIPDVAAARESAEIASCDLPWIRANLPKIFEKSLDGLRRINDIVKNLRDFARLDEASFDELDINAALDVTIETLRHQLDGMALQLETSYGTLPQVYCHTTKINQVLHGLLLNAIQASEPNGHIWLRSRVEGAQVVVEIKDEGCGIKAADLPRVFDPFFTTKPVGGGQGLGLAIAYGVVRNHGGSIQVESEEDRGTTFRLKLPLEPPAAS